MTDSEIINDSIYKYTNKGRVKEFNLNLLTEEEKAKFKKLSNKDKQRFIASVELQQMPSMFDEISLKAVQHPEPDDNSLADIQMAAKKYDELMDLVDNDPKFVEMKANYLKIKTIQQYIAKHCPHITQADMNLLLKLKPDISVNQFINYYRNIRDNKDLVALNNIQKQLKNPYGDDVIRNILNNSQDLSEDVLKLLVGNDIKEINRLYIRLNTYIHAKKMITEVEKTKDGKIMIDGDGKPRKKEVNNPDAIFDSENSQDKDISKKIKLPLDKRYDQLTTNEQQRALITDKTFRKVIKGVNKRLGNLKKQLTDIGFKINNDDEMKEFIYDKRLNDELQDLIREKQYDTLKNFVKHFASADFNNEYTKETLRNKQKQKRQELAQKTKENKVEQLDKEKPNTLENEPPRDTQNKNVELIPEGFEDESLEESESQPVMTTEKLQQLETHNTTEIPQILDVSTPEPVKTEDEIKQDILKSLPDDGKLYFLSSSEKNNPLYYGANDKEMEMVPGQLITENMIEHFTRSNPPIKSGYGNYLRDKRRFRNILDCIKNRYTIMALDLDSKREYKWNRNRLEPIVVPEDLEKDARRFVKFNQQYGKGLFSKIKKIYKAPESIEGIKDKLKTMDDMAKEINSLQTRIHENELMIKKMNEALNKLMFERKVKIESKKTPQFLSDISKAPTLRHVEPEEHPKPKPINLNPNSTEAMLKRKLEERRKDIEYSDEENDSETDWGAGMAGKIKIKTEDSQNKNGILMKDFFKKYLNLDSKADE